MTTSQWVTKKMRDKGWGVRDVNYEHPRSGFKCIEGGWLVLFGTEYDGDDYFEQIKAIPFDPKINGTIDQSGIIMAMTADDLKALINKIPVRDEKYAR